MNARKFTPEITQEFLIENFDYKTDGYLVAKCNGKVLDVKPNKLGYKTIRLCGKSIPYARLIFLFHFGFLPIVVDHISGNTSDNRIENLRAATHKENVRNRKPTKNRDLPKGVAKRGNRFFVAICVNRKTISLGSFSTSQDAATAYNKGALKYYGNFAKLNIL
jgi:hypothetical protein